MTNEQIIETLQYLIGSRYVPTVNAYIAELTGRRRIVGPGDISSREWDRARVNIETDNAGLIVRFSFA